MNGKQHKKGKEKNEQKKNGKQHKKGKERK